ncbi:MAG: hypothetical protein ACH350_04975 [Parachlamydiaceae bacterium]
MRLNSEKPSLQKPKELKDAPMPPLPFQKDIVETQGDKKRGMEVRRILNKEGNFTVQEAATLLKEMEEKGKKIKKMLEELYQLRGITPHDLKKYLDNQDNFTPEQWKLIKGKRRELIDSLPADMRALIEAKLQPDQSLSPSSAKSKERRKPGGAQRRGWIPMR